jgi:hypothetical protein
LLTLREESILRVFENRLPWRTCGSKRDDVTGVWRRLHNKELHALYSSPNNVWVIKSRKRRWVGYVACMGDRKGADRGLVGRPEGKRPLGRPRCRQEDNIKTDLRDVGWGTGWGGEAWTGLILFRIGTGDKLS